MVVARNCRKRRSLAVSSSSPTSLMLPADGTSEPFCNRPITVSDVTDLPEPLSPTRHSVSRSRTCTDTPSRIRVALASLPRPTTRFWMSRTMLVMAPLSPGHFEERSDEAIHRSRAKKNGLLRFARNDAVRVYLVAQVSLAALALLHAGIERVARGVTDQIDAEDRNRQQEPRPEDQRRLDLKIGAALRHDVAPGRRFRADAGPQ